ncbi:MarR family transcriptional regulator [Actinomycetes bacterium KLBMP 9759]
MDGAPRRPGPTSEIVDMLFVVTDHLKAQFADVAATERLTVVQARTVLRIHGPVSMRALAARMGYDASNMTGIVDGLESRGLVERKVLPEDRRVKHVELTEQGMHVRDRMRERLAEDAPAIGKLDEADRVALHAILRRAVERS